MSRRRWGTAALVATLMLLAAACSNVGSGGGSSPSGGGSASGPAVPDNSGTTIKIAINPWTGSAVNATIAAADALIGGLIPPPVGSDSLAPSTVNALASTLDDYNNGLIGPGHCADTPTHPVTWGQVKSTYRR